jgi:stage II sporulation protein R
MKKLSVIFVLLFSLIIMFGCTANVKEQYLRIHIRANSNLNVDQNIKYEIKDNVVCMLTPIIASCNNFNDVKQKLNNNLNFIKSNVDLILQQKNFNYTSNVKIVNEFFPSRYYEDVLLKANYYDAIIIELGQAAGDNWWCVVYPPLCFLSSNSTYGNNIIYKSKIVELIEKFFK